MSSCAALLDRVAENLRDREHSDRTEAILHDLAMLMLRISMSSPDDQAENAQLIAGRMRR